MPPQLQKASQLASLKKKSLWTALAAAEQIAPTTQRFGQHKTVQRVYTVPGTQVRIPVEALVTPKNTYRHSGLSSSSQVLEQHFSKQETTKKFKRPLLFDVANPVGHAARKSLGKKPSSPQTRAFSSHSTAWAQKPMPSIFSTPMVSRKPAAPKRPNDTKGKPPVSNGGQFGFNALGNSGSKSSSGPKNLPKPKKPFQKKFERREPAVPKMDEREVLSEYLKAFSPALTSHTIQAVLEIHDELTELVQSGANENTKVIYVSESGDIAGDAIDFKVLVKNPKLDLPNKSLKLVKQSPAMVKTQSLPSYVTPKYKLDSLTKEEKAAMKAEYKAQRKQAKAEEKKKKKAIENNRNMLEIHSTWSINLRDLRQQKFRKLAETLKEGRPAVVSFASKNVRNAIETKRAIDPEVLTAIDRERRQLLVEEVRVLAEECKVHLNVTGQIDLLMTMTLKP
ncbi:hypothetical protein CJU89_3584 [Yarrowia sp. B02]|nr:hypothetical protein CJU89_3584 [Yarrowia sp. B02]